MSFVTSSSAPVDCGTSFNHDGATSSRSSFSSFGTPAYDNFDALVSMYSSDVPSFLEIKKEDAGNKGRGLFVSENGGEVKHGTTLLAVAPLLSVLDNSNLFTRCSACFRSEASSDDDNDDDGGGQAQGTEGGMFRRCGGCKVVRYCSEVCQRSSWPSPHKPECQALKGWAMNYPGRQAPKVYGAPGSNAAAETPKIMFPDTPVRAVGKIIWGILEHGRDSTWTNQILSMQSHKPSLTLSQQTEIAKLCSAVRTYVGQDALLGCFGDGGAGAMMDLCCKFAANSFTLPTPSLTPIGVCVSPLTALINHSCVPNAVVTFPEGPAAPAAKAKRQRSLDNSIGKGKGKEGATPSGLLRVVAIRKIMPGEEILTSYVDLALPTELRQSNLRETYNFECECAMCKMAVDRWNGKEGNVDPRKALRCPARTGPNLDGRCDGVIPMPKDESGNVTIRCTKHPSDKNHQWTLKGSELHSQMKKAEEAEKVAEKLQAQGQPAFPIFQKLSGQIFPLAEPPYHCASTSHPFFSLLRSQLTRLLAAALGPPASISGPNANPGASRYRLALTISTEANRAMEILYPFGHPVRAVGKAEMGKLLVYVDGMDFDENMEKLQDKTSKLTKKGILMGRKRNLEMIRKALIEGAKECRIGFGGDGGIVGRGVERRMKEVEREIEGIVGEISLETGKWFPVN